MTFSIAPGAYAVLQHKTIPNAARRHHAEGWRLGGIGGEEFDQPVGGLGVQARETFVAKRNRGVEIVGSRDKGFLRGKSLKEGTTLGKHKGRYDSRKELRHGLSGHPTANSHPMDVHLH